MSRAGSYKHVVCFQRAKGEKDELGEVLKTWSILPGSVTRCKINPVTGSERFAAFHVQSDVDCLIECRYFSGLTTKDRIVHDSTIYDIKSILNVGQLNREYRIMAKIHGG